MISQLGWESASLHTELTNAYSAKGSARPKTIASCLRRIGFAWIVVCSIGCGDATDDGRVETRVRLVVPSDIPNVPVVLDYEFLCDRGGPSESKIEGSLAPPDPPPFTTFEDQITWTASVELPPGECLFQVTTPIQVDCNSCGASELVTIDPGGVNDIRLVLLCTLSICPHSGDAEISISVPDGPAVPELREHLAYALACDGAETGFLGFTLHGQLEAADPSNPRRWETVFTDLPAGGCTLEVEVPDSSGEARCQATREFDIVVSTTTTLGFDLHCGG